jgi:hypothetical protein
MAGGKLEDPSPAALVPRMLRGCAHGDLHGRNVLAAVHLGVDRGRPREWLEEYYFLLMCYGVSVVRFGNVQWRELLAAYVSAGVAAARLTYSRLRIPEEFDAYDLKK